MKIQNTKDLKQVSLVIPARYNDIKHLRELLAIEKFSLFGQVIVVLNGVFPCSEYSLGEKLARSDCKLRLVFRQSMLDPGSARNLGIKLVETRYCALLDVRTRPNDAWFGHLHEFILNGQYDLSIGSVSYLTVGLFAKSFLLATYGFNSIACLPGSILSIEAFSAVGHFLPFMAGEDSEWLSRVKFLNLPIYPCDPQSVVYYKINNERGFFYFVAKWFKNYRISFKLPAYQVQKYLYVLFLSFPVIAAAYIWNSSMAGWDQDSIFYIPYVTRSVCFLLCLSYILFRGLILPLKKGLRMKWDTILILPLSFLLAFCLDICKSFSALVILFDKDQ